MLLSRTISKRLLRTSVHIPKFCYQTLSAEDYLYNQRDSNLSKEILQSSLFPLPKSSKEINKKFNFQIMPRVQLMKSPSTVSPEATPQSILKEIY